MSDLINRQDAIEALCKTCCGDDHFFCISYTGAKDCCYDVKALRSLPSAEPKKGEWIPCSERLPEEEKMVIAYSNIYKIIHFNKLMHDGRWWKNSYDVTAWMPLPEPYEGGGIMSKLKPCPFCGKEAVIEDCGEHRYFVRCSKCGINQDKLYAQKCDAVKAWNRRAEDETKN